MNDMFSIGHSTLSWHVFIRHITQYDIGVVIDVRSRPRSRTPHFNGHRLRVLLNDVGVSYLWFGDRLGGISKSNMGYAAISQTEPFLDGVSQLVEIGKRTRLALMCAEHENIECHRCLLVGRNLLQHRGIDVGHIHRDGTCERQTEAEDRMTSRWDRGGDLFKTREQRLDVAYRLQARKIGVEA